MLRNCDLLFKTKFVIFIFLFLVFFVVIYNYLRGCVTSRGTMKYPACMYKIGVGMLTGLWLSQAVAYFATTRDDPCQEVLSLPNGFEEDLVYHRRGIACRLCSLHGRYLSKSKTALQGGSLTA